MLPKAEGLECFCEDSPGSTSSGQSRVSKASKEDQPVRKKRKRDKCVLQAQVAAPTLASFLLASALLDIDNEQAEVVEMPYCWRSYEEDQARNSAELINVCHQKAFSDEALGASYQDTARKVGVL